MKARIIALMLVAGIFFTASPASAQFKDLLNKGANSILDKKLKKDEEERKKKEAEEKKKNQQSGTQNQQQNQNPAGNFMQKKLMGMMGLNNVKYETKYAFTSSMTMEMQATDSLGKKSDKVLYTTYFDKGSKSFAMEFETVDKQSDQKQKSLMVFDYKNWAMLMLGDKNGEKSGIAMQMTKDSSIEAQQNQPVKEEPKDVKDLSKANIQYKATGRTKNIAGYSCKEYLYETPDGKSEVWATNDVVFDYSSAYGHMGGMQTLASGGTTYGMGTIMEMHTYDKHSKAQSDLTVIDIKPSNPKSIDLTGYQIIGMGGQGQQPTKTNTKNKK